MGSDGGDRGAGVSSKAWDGPMPNCGDGVVSAMATEREAAARKDRSL